MTNITTLDPIKTARDLLALYKINKFPIFPHLIAKRLGIDVHDVELPSDISGALQKEQNKDPVILVNNRDINQRKRFTIAHEIGHYMSRVLTDGDDQEFEYIDFRSEDSKNEMSEEEVFANEFAAELLMPQHHVIALHEQGASTIEMAELFGVSAHAISYRMDNLGLKRISYSKLFAHG